MKFVILHGAFGSPDAHWFPQLKEKLESLNQKVIIPSFPTDNWDTITKNGPKIPPQKQSFANWLKVFGPIAKRFKKKDKLCFVGHSLGPLFILHAVDKYNLKLDCAIFVEPFLRKLDRFWQIDHVNHTFYQHNFDYVKLRQLIPLSYALCSDNNPYMDKKFPLEFARKIDSSVIFMHKSGHMNSEVGLYDFPLVFELCKTRIGYLKSNK